MTVPVVDIARLARSSSSGVGSRGLPDSFDTVVRLSGDCFCLDEGRLVA